MASTKAADTTQRRMFMPRGYGASVRDLQRALGKAKQKPAPAPKPITLAWLLYGFERRTTSDGLTVGVNVVLKLNSGAIYVGEVVHAGSFVTLKLWGCREPKRFARDAIAACKVTPGHDWADAHEVALRQRRGEPALIDSKKVNSKEDSL